MAHATSTARSATMSTDGLWLDARSTILRAGKGAGRLAGKLGRRAITHLQSSETFALPVAGLAPVTAQSILFALTSTAQENEAVS